MFELAIVQMNQEGKALFLGLIFGGKIKIISPIIGWKVRSVESRDVFGFSWHIN